MALLYFSGHALMTGILELPSQMSQSLHGYRYTLLRVGAAFCWGTFRFEGWLRGRNWGGMRSTCGPTDRRARMHAHKGPRSAGLSRGWHVTRAMTTR